MDTVSLLYYMSILLFCSTDVDSSSTWLHSRWSRRAWFPAQHARHDHRRVLRQAAAVWHSHGPGIALRLDKNLNPSCYFYEFIMTSIAKTPAECSVKTMAELKTQCLLTSSVNIDNNLNIKFQIRIHHSRRLLLLIFCPVLVSFGKPQPSPLFPFLKNGSWQTPFLWDHLWDLNIRCISQMHHVSGLS